MQGALQLQADHAQVATPTSFPQTTYIKPFATTTCRGECSWLFAGIKPQQLERFYEMTRIVKYEHDEILFQEGELAFGFYLLCSGKVKLSKRASSGKKMILQILGPGDILGAETMFGGQTYNAYAKTLEPVTLHFIERNEFIAVLKEIPEVALHLIENLSNGIRTFQSKLVETAYESCHERLATVLLNMAARYGLPSPEGIDIGLMVTRGELAEMAGITTETTIRTLSQFQRKGWIKLEKHSVILTDVDQLEALSEFSKSLTSRP